MFKYRCPECVIAFSDSDEINDWTCARCGERMERI